MLLAELPQFWGSMCTSRPFPLLGCGEAGFRESEGSRRERQQRAQPRCTLSAAGNESHQSACGLLACWVPVPCSVVSAGALRALALRKAPFALCKFSRLTGPIQSAAAESQGVWHEYDGAWVEQGGKAVGIQAIGLETTAWAHERRC